MDDPKWEKVTPAKAQQWLNQNKLNRTLREGVAEKYAEDMKNGKWTECTAPIVFDEDNNLADGQHRLYAVTESETTQKFLVVRNLPRGARLNIDTHAPRTLVDNARVAGIDEGLSNALIATARAIAGGKDSLRTMSNSQKLDMVGTFREPAEWAVSHGPRSKRINNAVVRGAIGRAWCYEKEDVGRLEDFCKVLASGFANGGEDSAAVALRNYIQSQRELLSDFRENFLKAQNAIWYFMRRKPLMVVRKVKEERYPLRKGKTHK